MTNNIERFCIEEKETILYAMQQLDTLGSKVLFVHEGGRLIASLSDGDVRRWILSGGSLDSKVIKAANFSPIFLDEKTTSEEAINFLRERILFAAPIIDENRMIVDIVFDHNLNIIRDSKKAINCPVVVMAGGMGTRLYPYTKILPKPLIPIDEIPVSEHIINSFRSFGCSEFYMILNYKRNMIKAYFDDLDKDYRIHYIDEEEPLGTGGGLSLLRGTINETFILTNCDILIKEDVSKIFDFHKKNNNVITMVGSLVNYKIPYGIVNIEAGGNIKSLDEKPTLSFFTNTGCYIVEPEVIEEIPDKTNIGFPDIIERCKEREKKVAVYPIGEKAWIDMGQLDKLENLIVK